MNLAQLTNRQPGKVSKINLKATCYQAVDGIHIVIPNRIETSCVSETKVDPDTGKGGNPFITVVPTHKDPGQVGALRFPVKVFEKGTDAEGKEIVTEIELSARPAVFNLFL